MDDALKKVAQVALRLMELNRMWPEVTTELRAALATQAEPVARPEPNPLRCGTTGICSRSICICERDGLGDQCIWLRPSEPMIDGYPLMAGLPPPAQPQQATGFNPAADCSPFLTQCPRCNNPNGVPCDGGKSQPQQATSCAYPECNGVQPEDGSCCKSPFTSAMAEAAEAYFRSVGPSAHPLPAQFRWYECFRAMMEASPVRRAQPQQATSQTEPVAFDPSIGADRYQVVKGSFWWHIRIGDSTANVGKFHTKMAAEDMALKLLTAFRDGAFMQSKSAQPLQATAADALRRDNDNLRTVMIAAAEEIHAHWDAHCDAEGYGPANLMHRLEEGIPSEYGYTAGAFAALKAAQADEIAAAVAFERERCAALCEMWNTSPGSSLAKEIRGGAEAGKPQAEPVADELGWLIEMRPSENLLWWDGGFDVSDDYPSKRLFARMVNDVNKAVRFSRREDAQCVLDAMLAVRPSPLFASARTLYSVQEHIWHSAAQPQQTTAHFPIMLAICRAALSRNPTEFLVHQVTRLAEALSGDEKAFIDDLLFRATNPSM